MPFTLAHPAVVLPLRRLGLPLAALVAGAMSPDVPLFVPWPAGYWFTHSLDGVVTVDLAATLATVLVWVLLLREALVDLSPAAVRERLRPRVPYSGREWALAPVAAVAGALSHVAWDSFTHRDRWGVSHVAWLQAQHGPLVGYHWAQYGSGIVGLVVVGAWAAAALWRSPRTSRPPRVPELGARALATLLATVAAVAAVAAALSGWSLASGEPGGAGLRAVAHAVLYEGTLVGTTAGAAGLVLVAAAWHVRMRTRLSP